MVMDTLKVLKEHNIKITKPRMKILGILSDAYQGIDADFIYKKCLAAKELVNLSTVYRTLELFEEKNLIIKYDLGEKRYNFSLIRHEHHHTVECNSCHKILDLDCPMKQIDDLVSKETGFYLTEHRLELRGICKECLALEKKGSKP